ncbi:MAG TPA: ferritin-like domain-containing protein [Chthonomonadaceae bacterium]|nr:ferritin-like domain-containing protein [Chthonomonadaceae bacterium]
MKLSTLRDLYVEELKDLYSAETQILRALPNMARAAESAELRDAFQEHEHQTREQVRRLEQIFDGLNTDSKGKVCKGMQGLIAESAEFLEEEPDPCLMDAGLISLAQRVEHYEMAGYGSVRTYAQELGLTEQAELLQATLDEETEADRRLTALAEQGINARADAEEEAVIL